MTGETEWQSDDFCRPAGEKVWDRVLGAEVFLDADKVLKEGGWFTSHTLKEV